MRTRVGKSMVRAAFQCALLTGIVAQLRASGQVSEQMLKDDPRLDRRISCERKRTRLGELMEELTKQSGVRVSVRDVDNLSGVFVTICVKDERLADVLDAVWSLTSSFDGKCIVSRSGVAGDFAYELSESLRTKNRAVLLRQLGRQVLRDYTLTMISLSKMEPAARGRHKHRISESLSLDDDTLADGLLSFERTWDAFKLLDTVLSREDLMKLVEGELHPSINLGSLSPASRQLAASILGSGQTTFGGDSRQQTSVPERLEFFATSRLTATPMLLPGIFVRVPWGAKSISGGYGLEAGLRNQIRKRWMLPGDEATNAAEERIVAPEPSSKDSDAATSNPQGPQSTTRKSSSAISLRLVQAAKGANVPLIAILPRLQDLDPGTPTGQPLAGIKTVLSRSTCHPMFKWRNDVLLVCYPAWFVNDDSATPYVVVKRYLKKKDGLIPLRDLIQVVSSLTENQLNELAEEYAAIKASLGMRPLIIAATAFREITSSDGSILRPGLMEQLQASPILGPKLRSLHEPVSRVRLVEQRMSEEGKPALAIRAEALTQGNQWVSLGGFEQISR